MTEYSKILIVISFIVCLLSCDKEENHTDNYYQKALDFITEVFSSEFYDCAYIVKPKKDSNLLELIEQEMPALNYERELIEILKVEEGEKLEFLINRSKNFKFKNTMFKKGILLIDFERFTSIKTELDSKRITEKKEKFFSECPFEFYFISKPIFDKDYKIAIIDIQQGFTCLRSKPWIYELKNGKWKNKKSR